MNTEKNGSVINALTGEKVTIKAGILYLFADAFNSRNCFLKYDSSWDHLEPEGAEKYLYLLDKWEAAVKAVSPYVNIWYIARYGLSLN